MNAEKLTESVIIMLTEGLKNNVFSDGAMLVLLQYDIAWFSWLVGVHG